MQDLMGAYFGVRDGKAPALKMTGGPKWVSALIQLKSHQGYSS